MIKVKVFGTLQKTLGNEFFIFEKNSIHLRDIIYKLYNLDEKTTDFSYILSDIIIAINGIAISSNISDLILETGDEVSLIPITHGG